MEEGELHVAITTHCCCSAHIRHSLRHHSVLYTLCLLSDILTGSAAAEQCVHRQLIYMYVLYWSCYVITYSWDIVYVLVPVYDNGTAGYTDSKLNLDSDWLFYWSWTLFTIGEDCQWAIQRFTRKTRNVSDKHQVTVNRNLLHGMCCSSSSVASWTIYKVIKECFYKLGAECTPDMVRARQVIGVQYPTWLSAKLLHTVYTIFTVLFSAWAHSQNCCMINFIS